MSEERGHRVPSCAEVACSSCCLGALLGLCAFGFCRTWVLPAWGDSIGCLPQQPQRSAWGCPAWPDSSELPPSPSPWLQPRHGWLCCSPLPRFCSQAVLSDELVNRPHAAGGRRGKQLQEKEQIPLSHLMIFICVSVGEGALARSIALFSKMLCL